MSQLQAEYCRQIRYVLDSPGEKKLPFHIKSMHELQHIGLCRLCPPHFELRSKDAIHQHTLNICRRIILTEKLYLDFCLRGIYKIADYKRWKFTKLAPTPTSFYQLWFDWAVYNF